MSKFDDAIMGAIIGDIAGSRFEFNPIHSKDFELFVKSKFFTQDSKMAIAYLRDNACRFTDDTVMTLAICDALTSCKNNYKSLRKKCVQNMQELGKKYPLCGYGNRFNNWIYSLSPQPYNSFGNGSAMRISSVPSFAKDEKELKELCLMTTDVTHNHPEGIKGAEAVAMSIYYAQKGCDKQKIKEIAEGYYNLDFDYEELVSNYSFDETCQGSVPQSIYAFVISNSFEDAIRSAISLGGDADTMAAIAGSIAGAYYGVPQELKSQAKEFLTNDLLAILDRFEKTMK